MAEKPPVRIANAGGFWGDDPTALERQLAGGPLHYITLDFLAETTMSILQKQRSADPKLGYAHDFVGMVVRALPELAKRGVKVIANAGGVNPKACAEAIREAARERGLSPRLAVISGDDILGELPRLRSQGVEFANLDTGEPFSKVAMQISAANVYFGAGPIVEALRGDADIVVTGRVADAALVLAPLIHEFDWEVDDWDKLAGGVVAGHLLECGAQVSGGNFTDWRQVSTAQPLGYPIAEVEADGSFVLTKHPGTGGLVSLGTVKEQLVYEIGDPHAYLTPDVVADFSSVRLEAVGKDRVRVHGARGFEPTGDYKVSMAYQDGFKCSGSVIVCGPEALPKAQAYAELFWKRVPQPLEETRTEYLGWNGCTGAMTQPTGDNEIVLRLSARGEKKALASFAKWIPSLILSGPPGLTYSGSLPKVQEVVSFWPALLAKKEIPPRLDWIGADVPAEVLAGAVSGGFVPARTGQRAEKPGRTLAEALRGAVPLSRLCLARSGDKGDKVNIGVLARSAVAYAYLDQALSAQVVLDLFQELCQGTVTRYALPNVLGFNFVLDKALGGGGMTSLRVDALGKSFGQALLRQKLDVPDAIVASCLGPL